METAMAFLQGPKRYSGNLSLSNDSRVAVLGGGPAGSFFSYFLLDMAARVDMRLHVDIYEPRDFSQPAPKGCNMCGGIISESLVQNLAAEGINLPPGVVQRGIDSYVLHTDIGKVRIETPVLERRIAAVHRGAGPRDIQKKEWDSFDGYLQRLAMQNGAQVVKARVDDVLWEDGRPRIVARGSSPQVYDLLAVAAGVNSGTLKLFQNEQVTYRQPSVVKTYISEHYLGRQKIAMHLGSSMHVFLLNLPRLEFAALIPKGDYVTICLLGEGIDEALVETFMASPEVKSCFPSEWDIDKPSCHCSPKINIKPAIHPYGDRIVFIGDSGVTRLYKDGIGAAYRTAKAAAKTAIFHGISEVDFRRYYQPACRGISADNAVGKFIFAFTRLIQRSEFAQQAVLRMTLQEQQKEGKRRRMSMVLWDVFTGSAPYKEIFLRCLHPAFLGSFVYNIVKFIKSSSKTSQRTEATMQARGLGKVYSDAAVIIRQGETGECMYVVQEGQVEVLSEKDGLAMRLAVLGEGDYFGEMAIFEHELRSATVRAIGQVRVLTIDKKTLLRRIHEDPSLAFRIVQKMSQRIRDMNSELLRYKTAFDSHE